jgi:hypothetical protein
LTSPTAIGLRTPRVPSARRNARQNREEAMADQTPQFDKAPTFISDVQMQHAISDDGQAITITFSNFGAHVVAFGPPTSVRTFSLVLPLKNMAGGARLTGALQGGGALDEGTGGTLIFRAGGVSTVFDPLFAPNDTISFMKPIDLAVPAGKDLRMTIMLALEGNPSDPKKEAKIDISTVDLTIAPYSAKAK